MPDIYSVAAEFRRQLLDRDRAVARELINYYGEVYRRLQQQIDSLMRQIADARAAGEEVSPAWLYRAERLRLLQDQVQAEMRRFADYAGDQITEAQRAALRLGQEHAIWSWIGHATSGFNAEWQAFPSSLKRTPTGYIN